MEWHRESDLWRSGPYTIELVRPRHWVLTRSDAGPAADQLVRSEQEWFGPSLSKLKLTAERLEEARNRAAQSKRLAAILLVALVTIPMSAGLPGRMPALVTLAAAGVLIVTLAKLIDQLRKRPWDALGKHHQ